MAQANDALQEDPGPVLAATLGLIALAFLPLTGGGYSGTGYQIGFVLLPVAAGIGLAVCRRRSWPLLLMLGALLLSGLLCFHWIQQGRLLWYYLLQLPAAWVCVWVLFNQVPNRSRLFFAVVAVSTVLTCIWGWFLWMGRGTLHYQITSTFGLHNAYAGFLLLAWTVPAVGFLRSGTRLGRQAYGSGVLLICATLILTYSRASWVAFALQIAFIGIAMLAARRRGSRPGPQIAWLGAAVGILLCSALLLRPVRESLAMVGNFGGYSMQGRFRFWSAALEIFRDHPFGIGLGNFAYVYPQYQRDFIYYSVDPHSWPLQLLCELGIAGILVGLIIIAGFWVWVRRLWLGIDNKVEAAVLIAAVGGSLFHAAVDFDYTFGATTALLGALLAYGTWRSRPDQGSQQAALQWRLRLSCGLVSVLFFTAALFGEALTAERFILDRLRPAASLPIELQADLLEQCISYNPYNHSTHYQLAANIAWAGQFDAETGVPSQMLDAADRKRAIAQLDRALELNPRFPRALALKGLLVRPPWEGEKFLEHALELDPYNSPEHYYYYASLAGDDTEKRRRLLEGMEAIPAHDPIRPDHVRATWYKLNPLFREWWLLLSQLTEDEAERELYRKRYVRFKVYWEQQQREQDLSGLQDI